MHNTFTVKFTCKNHKPVVFLRLSGQEWILILATLIIRVPLIAMKITIKVIFLALLISGISSIVSAQSLVYQGVTVNETIDGKKEGPWVIFASMRNLPDYKPEDKYEEGSYKTNRKVGLWKRYYASGNTQSEVNYVNGRAKGNFKTYYDEPGVIEEIGTQRGKTLTGSFKRYHKNGQLAQVKNFNEKGQSQGQQKYIYPNGVVELEFSTSAGIEQGQAIRRYPNGDIKEIIEFGEGGVVKSRNQMERVNPPVDLNLGPEVKTSEKIVSGTINDGGKEVQVVEIPDGNRKVYNDNKDIWMDGTFEGGRLKEGKLYIYDEDGIIEKVEIFKNFKYAADGIIEF